MKLSNYFKAAAFVALAAMTLSCNDENGLGGGDKNGFSFKVSTATPIETKSLSSYKDIEEYCVDGVKLTIASSVQPNFSDPFDQEVTKASMINTADELSAKRTSFKVNIHDLDGKSTFSSFNGEVAYSNNAWVLQRTASRPNINWPDDNSGLEFDAYSCGSDASVAFSGNTVSFSTTAANATSSEDVLVARTVASANDVPVKFFHPLAAVRFRVPTAGLADNMKVKSITIKNVYKSGSFTVPADATLDNIENIKWNLTALGDRGTYTQEYTTDPNAGEDATFFIVPQRISHSVSLEVVFARDGFADSKLTVQVPSVGLDTTGDYASCWKPGYYYTYTISGGGIVDVEVSEDSFDGVKKTNVKAENTGSRTSVVRAVVVTNWCNSEGKIVDAYKGTITYNTNDWTFNESDGFYYHKTPVEAGHYSNVLIDSFKPNEEVKPTDSGFIIHTEMKVIMQAVEYDSELKAAKTAWGNNIPSISSGN